MKTVFVFGSNLAGVHGAGSAQAAFMEHGAIWGIGIGPQGKSYAIPTKDEYLDVMDIQRIEIHVINFLTYACENMDTKFNVVDIGCGLAGFTPEEIAPLFRDAPKNVVLSERLEREVEHLQGRMGLGA